MGKTKDSQGSHRPTLVGLFDRVLSAMEKEISVLPDILRGASPDKRLDFISKTLPLLLKYRESGQGDNWDTCWGG